MSKWIEKKKLSVLYCSEAVQAPKGGNTTGMQTPSTASMTSKQLQKLDEDGNSAIVEWVLATKQPISIVESDLVKFREIMQVSFPHCAATVVYFRNFRAIFTLFLLQFYAF